MFIHTIENGMETDRGSLLRLKCSTISEIDALLDNLASLSGFSVDENGVQSPHCRLTQNDILKKLFERRSCAEVVFLVKVVLKLPVVTNVHESSIMAAFHPHLWKLWKYQPNLRSACRAVELEALIRTNKQNTQTPSIIDIVSGKSLPLGINLANMALMKATSCAHVVKHMQTIGESSFVADVKYDGERNQVHFEAAISSSSTPLITLYSKSKRNSTSDRVLCHDIITASLGHKAANSSHLPQLNLDSSIQYIDVHDAILDSELLVYNEITGSVEQFNEARVFAYESTRNNDPLIAKSQKHYMIVYFDIMRLNGESLLLKPYWQRRELLRRVVREIPNHSSISEARVFHLWEEDSDASFGVGWKASLENCCAQLRIHFLQVCARPAEGLVCKGLSGLYEPGSDNLWMKLKKDYIEGFGDTADFVVIGGSYKHDQTKYLGITRNDYPDLLNSFYVACLVNTTDASNNPPKFRQIFEFSAGFSRNSLIQFNQSTSPVRHETTSTLSYTLKSSYPKPQFYFDPPLAVELKGGGFERRNGRWGLRGPRYLRTCGPDKGWWSCVTYPDFCAMGERSHQRNDAWKADMARLATVDFAAGVAVSGRGRKRRHGRGSDVCLGGVRMPLVAPATIFVKENAQAMSSFVNRRQTEWFEVAHLIPWCNPSGPLSKILSNGDLAEAFIYIPNCKHMYTESQIQGLVKPVGIHNVQGRMLHSVDALLTCTGWDGKGTEGECYCGIVVIEEEQTRSDFVSLLEKTIVVGSFCPTKTLCVVGTEDFQN
ncbi:hypothetical protein BC830DRAFT_1101043 [Chytriomyces sp. MP71]|nr:hypothetical protein BC830DRAFT_1101043 [Chytriomyces sp. MP71]